MCCTVHRVGTTVPVTSSCCTLELLSLQCKHASTPWCSGLLGGCSKESCKVTHPVACNSRSKPKSAQQRSAGATKTVKKADISVRMYRYDCSDHTSLDCGTGAERYAYSFIAGTAGSGAIGLRRYWAIDEGKGVTAAQPPIAITFGGPSWQAGSRVTQYAATSVKG